MNVEYDVFYRRRLLTMSSTFRLLLYPVRTSARRGGGSLWRAVHKHHKWQKMHKITPKMSRFALAGDPTDIKIGNQTLYFHYLHK